MESLIEIIKDVKDKADHVFVNKKQCELLARRFERIGEALKNGDTSLLDESAMEQIRLMLIKGQTLVGGYKDRGQALANALSRAENQKSFTEIHGDLDKLKTKLYWSDDENVTEDDAAESDRNAMTQNLDNLNLNGEPHVNMSNVKNVVVDKFRQDAVPDYDLSYLHIPMSTIVMGPPIKALPAELNKGDKHLEGLALVHKGKWNGCECAIKVFKSGSSDWNREELRKEVASLVKLRHPHITQLIGRAQDKDKTYVLYEKMDGDLRDLMKARIKKQSGKPPPFSPTEELSIIKQIAQGMFYLHQHGIVHGELKCTNLLVKQAGDDIDVKVSDFHCSRELGSNERYKPTHRTRWLPPEAFGHFDLEHPPPHDVLKQGDVYSFAMTCCEVVTGGYPFDGIKGDEVVKAMILKGDRPKLPDHLNDNLKSLIEDCSSGNPGNRPSFEEICDLLQIIVSVPTSSLTTRVLCCFGLGNARTVPVEDDILDEVWPPLDGDSSSSGSVESKPEVEGLPHYLKIEPKNLKRFRNGKLGSGASAQVWAATWHGCKFAVKYMKSNHVSKLRHEVDVMMKLLHPHVVRLVGFAAEGNRCAIVMELMDKSLEDFIKEKMKSSAKTPFSEAEAIAIITKLANGMKFMHSRGVKHGDLKCANVLVRIVQTKNRNNILDVKLVDFGLAHLESLVKDRSFRVGSCHAPEVILRDQDYDPMPADVYSFGMMCWEIITGKLPPPKMKPSNVREELWELLSDCWKGPQQRPTFSQICDKLATMAPRS
jgi:serine/threonine protein kinase